MMDVSQDGTCREENLENVTLILRPLSKKILEIRAKISGPKENCQEHPLPIQGLQKELLLYNKDFDWSLSLLPGEENIHLWNFPSKVNIFII